MAAKKTLAADLDEWYRKYRPTSLADVLGQDHVTDALVNLIASKKLPHAMLFSGNSGVGKTTIARILKGVLRCSDIDFCEINAADTRGIDTIRDINSRMRLAPIGGASRIFLLDECHKLTGDAQTALLKMTEDTPKHVYFIFATTHIGKVIPTLKTRLMQFKLEDVSTKDLQAVMRKVLRAEGWKEAEIEADLLEKIAEVSEGSVRNALVELQRVMSLDVSERMSSVTAVVDCPDGFKIAQLLAKGAAWSAVADAVRETKDDVEKIRHTILGYASSMLLRGGRMPQAVILLENFQFPFYDSGKPGLVLACLRSCKK